MEPGLEVFLIVFMTEINSDLIVIINIDELVEVC
jgi:hypothetical protein